MAKNPKGTFDEEKRRKRFDQELQKLILKSEFVRGEKIEDFKIIHPIGCGGFATVLKAQSKQHGFEKEYVAIKKMEKRSILKKKSEDRVIQEIQIHRKIQHSSIVKFHQFFYDADFIYLVLDLCEYGSLEKYLKEMKRPLSEERACHVITQVIDGIMFLHRNPHFPILHRDLSLKNILVSKVTKTKEIQEIKIADFGLATYVNPNEKKNTVLGTPKYMAPEVVKGNGYTMNVDSWSVGLILYVLLYNELPFNNNNGGLKYDLTFPHYASTDAQELLCGLLKKNPNDRISIRDALQYSFFQNNKNKDSQRSVGFGMSSFSGSSSRLSRPVQKSGYQDSFQEDDSCCYSKLSYKDEHANKSHSSGRQRKKSPSVKLQESKSPSSTIDQLKNKIQPLPNHQDVPDYMSSSQRYSGREHNSSERNSRHKIGDQTKASFRIQDPPKTHKQYFSNDRLDSQLYVDPKPRSSSSPLPYPSIRLPCPTEEQCSNTCFSGQNAMGSNMLNGHMHEEYKYKESVKESYNNGDSLKKPVNPLNTTRLLPRRHETKSAIVSILKDGQVCMEFLTKDRKYITLVCFISQDGWKMKLYKPEPYTIEPSNEPPFPSHGVQDFTLMDLPKKHWKRYECAKQYINIVRAKTSKVTIFKKDYKCIMMENAPNPDFELHFYNGCLITEKGNKRKFTDEAGQSYDFTDESHLWGGNKEMLNIFKEMKKQCKDIEAFFEKLDKERNDNYSYFPVSSGSKPKSILRSKDASKENVTLSQNSSALNGALNAVNSCDGTINTGSNPFQKGAQSPSPDKKSEFKSISEILPQLKYSPKVENEIVFAEYKDSIQMWACLKNNNVHFYHTGTKQRITNIEQNPDMMKRKQNDLPIILGYVINELIRTT